MHRRSLLKTTLPSIASVLAGCSSPFQSRPLRASGIESHMTFLESTPADRPLVVDGLDGDGPTNEVWGRLFTERPKTNVFTDRIEEESPYMRNHVHDDRYDERFNVLVQMRFATPRRLQQVMPHRTRWVGADHLRVPLESNPDESPSGGIRTADTVVATSLLIFEYDAKAPASVVLPVQAGDGTILAEVIAR